jgi:hypothetical protein
VSAMSQQVVRQAALALHDAGAVITVRTLVGLLSSVYPQVLCQVALLSGAVITVCTLVGLLQCAHS